MRLAYLSSRTAPHLEADVQQMLETAVALGRQGVTVDLLLARKWSQVLRSSRAVRSELASHYSLNLEGIRVRSLIPGMQAPVLVERLTGGRFREWTLLSDLWLLVPLFAATVPGSYDVIYSRTPIYAVVASLLGFPVVFETHSPRPVRSFLRLVRRDRLVGVIVHSEVVARKFRSEGLENGAILVCRNAHNPLHFRDSAPKAELRSRLGLPADDTVVCYSGRIKSGKSIDTVLELARRTPEIVYLLIGPASTTELSQINRMAAALQIRNVRFVPRVQPDVLSHYLRAADILLIPPSSKPLQSGRTVLPLKVYSYLASGTPIVAPRLSDVSEVLTHGKDALLVAPDGMAECAEAIRRLRDDPALAARLGGNAATAASLYTWERRAKAIFEFVTKRLASASESTGWAAKHEGGSV